MFKRIKQLIAKPARDYTDEQIEIVKGLTKANHDFCNSMHDLMTTIADVQMQQQNDIQELYRMYQEMKV